MSLENFKQWLTINCDEPTTVYSYYRETSKCLAKVNEPLTQEKLDTYFAELRNTGKSKNTFNMVIKSLRKYIAYANLDLILPKYKTPDKRINKYFTEEYLKNEVLPNLQYAYPKNVERITLIIKLLFFTGIRRKELLTLQRNCINFKKLEIELVDTKGNRDRIVPLKKKLAQDIELYFKRYPETHNAFDVTRHQLEYLSEVLKEKFNIVLNPRLCRHSSATNLVKNNVHPNVMQKILGHADIETTMIYSEADLNLVKSTYDSQIKGF